MIIEEILPDNPDLVKRYSDKGVYIHGGLPEGDYTEAIDLISANRVYTETNIPILPNLEDAEAEEAKQALHILLNT